MNFCACGTPPARPGYRRVLLLRRASPSRESVTIEYSAACASSYNKYRWLALCANVGTLTRTCPTAGSTPWCVRAATGRCCLRDGAPASLVATSSDPPQLPWFHGSGPFGWRLPGANDPRRTTNDRISEDPMSTKVLIGPHIRTALPGPNAQRVLEGDAQYISPSYTRSYPLVAQARPRHRGHRRGWQRILRFLGRHRRDLDRSLPPSGGGRDPGTGRRTHSHVRHRFLLPEPGYPRRAPLENRPHARPPPRSTTAIRAPRPSSAR